MASNSEPVRDLTQPLPSNHVDAVTREIDKVTDRNQPNIENICIELTEALSLPVGEVFDFLRERLTPDVLLTSATMSKRQVFHAIRKLLEVIGIQVSRTRGVPMPNKICDAIFSYSSDVLAEANTMLTHYKNTGVLYIQSGLTYHPGPVRSHKSDDVNSHPASDSTRNFQTRNESPREEPIRGNLAKQRQGVSNGFRGDATKFSGSRGFGLPLHVVKRNFEELIYEQEIPQTHVVQLMQNCLSGIANEFFYATIRNKTKDGNEAFSLLEKRFSSKQHHFQALTYLKQLSFSGIRSERSCSDMEALSSANARILEYIPPCGPSYQGEHQDGHMNQFMADIVDGKTWTQPVLTARITSTTDKYGIDYETFYSMLVSALTLVENRKTHSIPSENPTYYGETYGRSREARYPKYTSGRYCRKKRSPAELLALKAKTRCLRCKKLGHWKNECPDSRSSPSMTQIISARIKEREGTNRAAAEVLFAIAEDEDVYEEYLESITPIKSEKSGNTFETLLTASYGEQKAEADLENTFEKLTESVEHENVVDESQDF